LQNIYILTPSQISILKDIQDCLDHVLGLNPTPLRLDWDSDDYDSEDLDGDLESSELDDSNEPSVNIGPTSTIHRGTHFLKEEEALEAFREGFDFHEYSSELLTRLSDQLFNFLVTTMEKEVIGQFDHELLAFTAIMSMDFRDKAFKAPGVIAQAYSALIYYFQLVVVEAASAGAQSGDQSGVQSTRQSGAQSTRNSGAQSHDQSAAQSTRHSGAQSTRNSGAQSHDQSAAQSTRHSDSQSRDQSAAQSTRHSGAQSTRNSGAQSTRNSGAQSADQLGVQSGKQSGD
jgi:hypothetical protein